MPLQSMQVESEKLSAKYAWILILDYGSISVVTFALLMLLVQLGFAGERYMPRHTILLVAALAGFACHVCMSRLLIGARNVKDSRKA
jgi:cyanate permease